MPAEEETIRRVLRDRGYNVPDAANPPLGANGLGLDSIAIVEVLLEVEEHFRIAVVDDDLLANDPLTIEAVAAHVRMRLSA